MKKMLKVNLSTRKVECFSINTHENVIADGVLVFESPLLAGHGIVGVNRLNIYYNENKSSVGGYFAHYLKCSGFDYLVIEGKSEEPVYLYIDKDNIKIKNANHIALLNPKETEKSIKKELNDYELEIAELGIAGMDSLDFSKLMFRGHKSCGKDGLGKMMGDKNLKAIAIKKYNTLIVRDKGRLCKINNLMINRLGEYNLLNWYDENNSCYGCLLNCKSTSVKKIMKLGFCLEEAKAIDDISNEYGMDSIIFANLIYNYQRVSELLQNEYDEFADKILRREIDTIKYQDEKKLLKNKSIKSDYNCSFEDLGFCKFLINRNIIDERLKEELLSTIL